MDGEEFVNTIKQVVIERSVNGTIKNLTNPPGRSPELELKNLSRFYNELSHDQRELIKKIIWMTSEMTVFGFLCVLDGVRAIEDDENKGTLELIYRKDGISKTLNDPNQDFLHDLL